MKILKNLLFKSTGPISTKLGTEHPWEDGNQIVTNKGPHHTSRGDNSKIIKIYGEYLEFFYFRTTGPVSTKHGIKSPWVEEIQIFFSNKESYPFTRGNNS